MEKSQKIKFICLPGGGTSSLVFYKWFGLLSSDYRPCFIDLPGRGLRKNEAPLTTIEAITDDLYAGLKKLLDDGRKEEYVLFGYCMGAIFLYELYHRLKQEGRLLPLHLFLIAADVPNGEMYKENFITNPATKFQFYDLIKGCFPEHTFKDSDLLQKFRKSFVDILYCNYSKNGNVSPVTLEELAEEGILNLDESFEFKECLKLANDLIHILSIDCQICSDYQKNPPDLKVFQCGITGISGSEDLLYPQEIMQHWKSYTCKDYEFHQVTGGHRILLEPNPEAVSIFNEKVKDLLEEIL